MHKSIQVTTIKYQIEQLKQQKFISHRGSKSNIKMSADLVHGKGSSWLVDS